MVLKNTKLLSDVNRYIGLRIHEIDLNYGGKVKVLLNPTSMLDFTPISVSIDNSMLEYIHTPWLTSVDNKGISFLVVSDPVGNRMYVINKSSVSMLVLSVENIGAQKKISNLLEKPYIIKSSMGLSKTHFIKSKELNKYTNEVYFKYGLPALSHNSFEKHRSPDLTKDYINQKLQLLSLSYEHKLKISNLISRSIKKSFELESLKYINSFNTPQLNISSVLYTHMLNNALRDLRELIKFHQFYEYKSFK